MSERSVCLVVLDGWGLAEPGPGNAIGQADTPVFDELWEKHPHTTLTTWGPAVGLPEGQMGNSEVGHLNLGAGAVVKQDLLRIDESIEDGSFYENETLRSACETERLHLLGLVSDGGVHASMEHLRALVELARREGVPDVVIHAFTDGRDTSPHGGAEFIAEVEGWEGCRIATVSGRYYAMDRDNRWERTQLAFDAIVKGEAELRAESAVAAVKEAYERDETDEFIKPTLVEGEEDGRIREGDSAIFFNFRPDRARQLTTKLAELPELRLATLTEYHEDWDHPVAFPPARPELDAGVHARRPRPRPAPRGRDREVRARDLLLQRRRGGPVRGRGALPRGLAARRGDLRREARDVRARGRRRRSPRRWREGDFGFGIINFANPDMVGHTGVIEAAVKAVETVDECLGRGGRGGARESGGVCVITADHGNADHMLEEDGSPNTAHSMNPVPLVVTADVGRRCATAASWRTSRRRCSR